VIRCSLGEGVHRQDERMDSRLRGKDGRRREGRINYLVVLADAGTHTSWQGWIPAFAESTPQKRPSHGNKVLGGMTELRRKDGNLPLWAGMNSVSISHVWYNTYRVTRFVLWNASLTMLRRTTGKRAPFRVSCSFGSRVLSRTCVRHTVRIRQRLTRSCRIRGTRAGKSSDGSPMYHPRLITS